MRYSDDIIEEVLHRTDLVGLIGENVRLKRTGSNYMGLCPFHAEKTPSFSVSPARQMYYCFGCHAGGNAITYMMEYNNFTFVEALKELAERAGVTLPEESLSEEQKAASMRRAAILEVLKKAAGFYHYCLKQPSGEHGLKYLRGRGLAEDTLKRFGLGYANRYGDSLYRYLKGQGYEDELLKDTGLFRFDEKEGVSDRFWNRVMFPIADARGRVIGFGGRVMGEGKPKYLNSPESVIFNKRKHLFALNYARQTRRKNIILCEGYMDVITMHQAGFTNACASLGTALTSEQALLLARFTGEVLLLYDSDSAGVQAALRAIPILKEAGLEARVVDLSPHKDPDEFIRAEGAEAMEARLESADNAFLFELTQEAKNYRRSDPGEWTAFQHAAAKRLLMFPEEMERENYLEAVCARFGFAKDAMRRLVGREAYGGAERAVTERGPKKEARRPEDSAVTAQKLMLCFLASYPEAYAQTKTLIGGKDFTDPLCGRIAGLLYPQLEAGAVSEAAIIAQFPDSADEREAAGIFHTKVPAKNGAELDRAFTDTVIRMLKSSNDAYLLNADITDMNVYGRYIENKKKLEQFEKGSLLHLPWQES